MRGLSSPLSLNGELFEVIDLRKRNGVGQKETKRRSQGSRAARTGSTIQSCLVPKTLVPKKQEGAGAGGQVGLRAGKVGPLVTGCPLSQASSEQ